MPVAEDLAWPLDLEVLLDVFGGLVVEQPVGVLLPRENLQLEAWLGESYVAGLLPFINRNLNHPSDSNSPQTLLPFKNMLYSAYNSKEKKVSIKKYKID